jgi:hypothetical protein
MACGIDMDDCESHSDVFEKSHGPRFVVGTLYGVIGRMSVFLSTFRVHTVHIYSNSGNAVWATIILSWKRNSEGSAHPLICLHRYDWLLR